MESICTTIEIKPSIAPSSSEEVPISPDNSKQSNRNLDNLEETAEKNISQTEFVSVKIEPDLCNDIVKTEPLSPSADDWHYMPIKYEPEYHEINVEVSIKEEPADTPIGEDCNLIVPDGAPPKVPNIFISDVSEEVLSLNSTIDGQYMCPICHKRFASKGNVQRHMLLHTREKFECNVCFRQFLKQGHYERHLLTHSTEKTFKCEECGKLFRTTSNLEQHKRIHLAVKPFECEKCTRQFAVKAQLTKHQGGRMCKLPRIDPLICNVCDKVFDKEFLLKSHLRRHTTERPYTCEKCKMSFKYKSTLVRHIQLHNNIKPYSCNICKKKFTHSGLLKPHMRKHTGEKPYLCPVCNKSFAHKHNMQRHTARHAKIKILICEFCGKKFPKESRLIYHMRTHSNAKPFVCTVCGKTFSHKQNIVRHFGRKHPNDTYNCPDTDASVAKEVWFSVMNRSISVEVSRVDNSEDELLPELDTEQIIGK